MRVEERKNTNVEMTEDDSRMRTSGCTHEWTNDRRKHGGRKQAVTGESRNQRATNAFHRHGRRTPNEMRGAHAARRSATWCVPNGEGELPRTNMSISEEMVATICVAEESSWKNKIRHTMPVKLGIGVSVRAASYVDTAGKAG